ncbi:MAG: hypothetical protein K1X88_20160 [Nannocystaceae bacterium]|nr:hypothetical protein [Nannocystaceae bacterium]
MTRATSRVTWLGSLAALVAITLATVSLGWLALAACLVVALVEWPAPPGWPSSAGEPAARLATYAAGLSAAAVFVTHGRVGLVLAGLAWLLVALRRLAIRSHTPWLLVGLLLIGGALVADGGAAHTSSQSEGVLSDPSLPPWLRSLGGSPPSAVRLVVPACFAVAAVPLPSQPDAAHASLAAMARVVVAELLRVVCVAALVFAAFAASLLALSALVPFAIGCVYVLQHVLVARSARSARAARRAHLTLAGTTLVALGIGGTLLGVVARLDVWPRALLLAPLVAGVGHGVSASASWPRRAFVGLAAVAAIVGALGDAGFAGLQLPTLATTHVVLAGIAACVCEALIAATASAPASSQAAGRP